MSTQPDMSISTVNAAEHSLPSGKYPDLDIQLFQQAPAPMAVLNENNQILIANLALAAFLNLPVPELLHQPFCRFILPEDQPVFDRLRQALGESGTAPACALRLGTGNGLPLWVHLAARQTAGAAGAPECHLVLGDITAFMQQESCLKRLYVMLAQVNQAIVNYRETHELYRAICRIAVKYGQFRMAWVGLVDGPTGLLKPVAHEGHEDGYLKAIHVNVNPGSAFSQGPVGQAILKKQVIASNDTDPAFQRSPWRQEMLKHDFRAIASVPFHYNQDVVGTLNLYSETPCAFSAEEMDLLKRIGDAVSFALECLEIEARRQRAELALRESEAQNRAFIHAIPDLIFRNNRAGEYLAVHAPDPHLLAAPIDAILHHKIGEFLPKGIAGRCLKAIAAALDTRTLQKVIYTLAMENRKRRFEARIAPCTADTVLTIVRDITELEQNGKRKRPRRRKQS